MSDRQAIEQLQKQVEQLEADLQMERMRPKEIQIIPYNPPYQPAPFEPGPWCQPGTAGLPPGYTYITTNENTLTMM